MRVTHEFEVRARCPVDGSEDVYVAEVTASNLVPVEQILKVAAACPSKHVYQETLTRHLYDALRGAPWVELAERAERASGDAVSSVTTVGHHSGVKTTVTVGS